jgi:hypothetical protein
MQDNLERLVVVRFRNWYDFSNFTLRDHQMFDIACVSKTKPPLHPSENSISKEFTLS